MVKGGRINKSGAIEAAARQHADREMLQQRLDAALESMSDAFALFDTEDRLILNNQRFVEFFPFLEDLGELKGQTFYAMVAMPNGEWGRLDDPSHYVAARMQRHRAADGQAFDIPLESGGWARVHERRTPDGGIVSTWSDVTELKAAEQHLLDAIAGIREGFVLLDTEHSIRLCNKRFRDIHAGARISPLLGTDLTELLRQGARQGLYAIEGDVDAFVARTLKALDGEGETRLEIAMQGGGWILASHRRMGDGSVVGIWTDLTAQKKREAELIAVRTQLERQTDALSDFARLLSRQARSDALTGLPNRFALEERLDQIMRDEVPGVWLLFIDLDHFKAVNDAAGHAAGDEVLRNVAQFLKAQLRGDDMLARLGGDEFAIVLTDVEEPEAIKIAQRLNVGVQSRAFVAGTRSFALGLSIGLVRAGPTLPNVSSLLAAADTACYVAKDAGRGRVQLYEPGDRTVSHAQETLSWAERIQLGLEADLFVLHLQAIVDEAGSIRGYESLIRLTDEQGTLRSPASFLPAARRLGFMGRIDDWVCRRTLEYAGRLAHRGTGQYVSMNFGVRTLSDPLFQRALIELLDRNRAVESALRIEITETDQIDDIEVLATFLDTLRARGLKLYLDDFGSGYNSFDVLKKLHVDGIKIDWTVTHDLLNDPIDEALIKAAVSIADSLGLELVSEGVEREEELNRLRALGVRLFQGHYFHRPEDADTALLR